MKLGAPNYIIRLNNYDFRLVKLNSTITPNSRTGLSPLASNGGKKWNFDNFMQHSSFQSMTPHYGKKWGYLMEL